MQTPSRTRLMALMAALLFTFTFIGLPSVGKYYLQTSVFDAFDMVGWMERLGDATAPELSSVETQQPRALYKAVRVSTVTIRTTSVIDSSMGVIDSSMGVIDSSMGVTETSF